MKRSGGTSPSCCRWGMRPATYASGNSLVPRDGAQVLDGEGLAQYLNERLVSVKVDREERPDAVMTTAGWAITAQCPQRVADSERPGEPPRGASDSYSVTSRPERGLTPTLNPGFDSWRAHVRV